MSALEAFPDHRTPSPRTTQAAEGLPRRPFTVAEIEAMVAAGIMDEHERVELIGGELVPMSPKGIRHETLKSWVNMQLARGLPGHLAFTPETTFRLSEDTFLEPDFVVYDKAVGLEGLNGATCVLAIELGDSSLAYDRGRKAQIYAGFAVAELWVIDAVRLTTRIHRAPTPTGYRLVTDVEAAGGLSPKAVPDLTLTLADFA
ncbi:Uma2 family endonuclease [Aurantimonas sp. VKM B-3413]|uniref:Uma2 family endonuclease n=1 Tax=Aurantimonas sp. VKM B-3413 TaxID=2779401 RepID=UPI001E46889F|nr:Uma2 family endonuclease [Aurantimonas sp. VKM B-3413]MCB8838617.1 Uma2 family endonuclease [Aurantimonas sp. VKM B-3413]